MRAKKNRPWEGRRDGRNLFFLLLRCLLVVVIAGGRAVLSYVGGLGCVVAVLYVAAIVPASCESTPGLTEAAEASLFVDAVHENRGNPTRIGMRRLRCNRLKKSLAVKAFDAGTH